MSDEELKQDVRIAAEKVLIEAGAVCGSGTMPFDLLNSAVAAELPQHDVPAIMNMLLLVVTNPPFDFKKGGSGFFACVNQNLASPTGNSRGLAPADTMRASAPISHDFSDIGNESFVSNQRSLPPAGASETIALAAAVDPGKEDESGSGEEPRPLTKAQVVDGISKILQKEETPKRKESQAAIRRVLTALEELVKESLLDEQCGVFSISEVVTIRVCRTEDGPALTAEPLNELKPLNEDHEA